MLKVGGQNSRYEVFPGVSSPLVDDGGEPPAGIGAQDDGKFTVNLDQASLAEASKLILGETLGYNYTIDPRVQGNITLVSNRPLSARQLLSSYEGALRLAGAALIQSEGNFKIVALQEVLDGEMGTANLDKRVSAGYGVNAVPLRFVSPASMMEVLDSFIARAGSVRASNVGNMILIRGPAQERRSLVEVITSFDVDWMKDQTSGIASLENGRAEDVAGRVSKVFAQDTATSGPNALRVIPVPTINSIIVIANDQAKVKRAITWIKRLDREDVDAPNVYVYAAQNGNAVELARILNATFGDGGNAGVTAEVAPDKQTMDVSVDSGNMGSQNQQGQDGAAPKTDQPADTLTTSSTETDSSADTSGSGAGGSKSIRITANPANNTIVISATPKDYRRIIATLRQIDSQPTQVLIKATIVEVQLNDELKYGVQAYFQSGNFSFSITDAIPTKDGIAPATAGLNFLLGGFSNPKLIIDALSKITDLHIVSSPSILVLENETATIKVGDQIPIQTQTAETTGGNFVNNYEYRDTGVVLKVRPRVSANGMVTIELGQELSAVSEETGVGGNPEFKQRNVTSKVSVNDTQTVLLGGLIAGTEEGGRSTVPGADKVPLLGKLVGTTSKTARRNELIVLITPTIIRNGEDAARESQDLRDTMKNLNFN
ncbi:type II secretion system secretin GspD [Aestuariivirga sp.]|uniref:type II secretion system secretin GspD n=1 Tax=Aestuariivirga sp. TaxID=2650926 RepID=UPI003BAD39E8